MLGSIKKKFARKNSNPTSSTSTSTFDRHEPQVNPRAWCSTIVKQPLRLIIARHPSTRSSWHERVHYAFK
jgi:hypothetical protein